MSSIGVKNPSKELAAGVSERATLVAGIAALNVGNIVQFGAVSGGDGAVNATALIDAGTSVTGAVIVPEGVFDITATVANGASILALLNRIECRGTLNINLDAGLHSHTAQVVVNSASAHKVLVTGAETVATTATSQISVSGTAKAYSVVIGVVSSAGIAVNDYVMIRQDVAGTGDFDIHAGVWKVTAVDAGGANRLTLLNTCHAASFPTNTLTGGAVVALKTRIKFTASDGFRFEGGSALGLLDKVAILGDYDIAAMTGTVGTHGIVTSSPVVHGGGSSNADYDPAGFIRCGDSVGISGFGEQGVAISGRGSMVANFIATSSNRKRGIYAEGGHIRCKFATSNGNGEDGIIADTSGFIQAALSIASGNGLNGYWSTNASMLNCSQSRASNNLSDGYEARGATRLSADLAVSSNNGGKGFTASDGGMIDADSAVADSNGGDGFLATSGGLVDADSSVSTNNGGWGYEAEYNAIIRGSSSTTSGNASGNYHSYQNSTLFSNSGAVQVDESPADQVGAKWWNSALNHYWTGILTSIGDLVFGSDGASRWVMKADGTLHPNGDNTQDVGRAANRGRTAYFGTGTINTSDEREKTELLALDATEQAVARELKSCIRKFQFLEAVEQKGAEARIHVGVGVQTVKAVFESHGLDPARYALFCYDEWEAEYDDDGREVLAAGNRYGIRYEELLAFIVGSL